MGSLAQGCTWVMMAVGVIVDCGVVAAVCCGIVLVAVCCGVEVVGRGVMA